MDKRPSATAALIAFLTAVLCLLGATLLSVYLSGKGLTLGSFLYVINACLQGFAFGLPVYIYYRRNRGMGHALRRVGLDPLAAVLIALSAPLGMLALNSLTLYWMLFLESLGLSLSTGAELIPQSGGEMALSLLTMGILPALFEEGLFRGLLLPSLEKLGRWPAVLLSALLFTLPHARIEAFPAHFILGILLGWLVLNTGSLLSSMVFHFAYNTAILITAYVSTGAAEGAMPTLPEAIEVLPMAAILLGLFLLLLYGGMERGRNRQKRPLMNSIRQGLSPREKILLGICLLLLIGLEGFALLSMLPGAGA